MPVMRVATNSAAAESGSQRRRTNCAITYQRLSRRAWIGRLSMCSRRSSASAATERYRRVASGLCGGLHDRVEVAAQPSRQRAVSPLPRARARQRHGVSRLGGHRQQRRVVAGAGPFAREQLVEHQPERIHVGARRHRFAAPLLRAAVGGRDAARAGQRLARVEAGVEQLGDAEVEQFDSPSATRMFPASDRDGRSGSGARSSTASQTCRKQREPFIDGEPVRVARTAESARPGRTPSRRTARPSAWCRRRGAARYGGARDARAAAVPAGTAVRKSSEFAPPGATFSATRLWNSSSSRSASNTTPMPPRPSSRITR